MQHISTALLIVSIIVINQGSGITAQDDELLAIETQNKAFTIIHNPKYVTQQKLSNQTLTKPVQLIHKLEQKPASKPPNIPNKPSAFQNYYNNAQPHYGQIKGSLPPRTFQKQSIKMQYSPNSIYKFPKVIPLPPRHRSFYTQTSSRPIMYAASTGNPLIAKIPKFSLPQVINGIRTDIVKPPVLQTTTSSTTTTTQATTTTTTQKVLRTKRIWPKRILDKKKINLQNMTMTKDNTTKTNTTDSTDRETSESNKIRYAFKEASSGSTTVQPSTTRGYRPVTRKVKVRTTTTLPATNFTKIEPNEWVPIMPTHYTNIKSSPATTKISPAAAKISKRSDILPVNPSTPLKHPMFLQSFGLVPVKDAKLSDSAVDRKTTILFKRKRLLKPSSSGYSGPRGRSPMHMHGDLDSEGSHRHNSHPHLVTKIKHHHHHHHHRYIKTVEKPIKVPYKIEVPKPYPVKVEKKVPVPVEKVKIVEKPVPYPVTVEKQIPYPIGIKIPHPVPVKVVEKEYVPKPYPVIQRVPVIKHVHVKVPQPVPVPVEKKVPYPVEVKVPVPVDRPVPVPVHVEKQVPYPVPVKVFVPQPYPVEKKVPYPVQVKVKEPVEVIKHVPLKVPYPQPYAVKVPVPVHVEKRVPYPVEVEKKVPVPVEVLVPQRVEVEKRVPVYIPKPYPVEKKVSVPYPVKIPYPVKVPVRVPVKVPVEVPIYVHHPVQFQLYTEDHDPPGYEHEQYGSSTPHTVTVHGNTGYNGFLSRSDNSETTAMSTPSN